MSTSIEVQTIGELRMRGTAKEECQLTLQVATEKEKISAHKVACWWHTDIRPHTAPCGLDRTFPRSCPIADSYA